MGCEGYLMQGRQIPPDTNKNSPESRTEIRAAPLGRRTSSLYHSTLGGGLPLARHDNTNITPVVNWAKDLGCTRISGRIPSTNMTGVNHQWQIYDVRYISYTLPITSLWTKRWTDISFLIYKFPCQCMYWLRHLEEYNKGQLKNPLIDKNFFKVQALSIKFHGGIEPFRRTNTYTISENNLAPSAGCFSVQTQDTLCTNCHKVPGPWTKQTCWFHCVSRTNGLHCWVTVLAGGVALSIRYCIVFVFGSSYEQSSLSSC